MKWGAIEKIGFVWLAAASLAIAGCGGSGASNVVAVAVSPAQTTVIVNQSLSVTAIVTGATDTTVTWVCTFTTTTVDSTGKSTTSTPAPCTSSDGTLSSTTDTTITYTAPAVVQSPAHLIKLTATSNADKAKSGNGLIAIDSGIRVVVTPTTATVGTGENFKFTDSISNDTTPPKGVTWAVTADATATTTSTSCAPGCGSVDAQGKYTAPATLPTQATVTVYATSVADTSRIGQATVTLVSSTSNPITFTGIFPTTAARGGTLQDIYLNVTNLRSTVAVQFNGQTIDPSTNQLKIITTTTTTTSGSTTTTTTTSNLARLRLNSNNLSLPAGSYPITISDQNGVATSFNLQLVDAPPALVAAAPDSFIQNSTGQSFLMNGGFYGSSTNPIVQALFNEQIQGVPNISSRQMQVPLTSQLQTAGLFPVRVLNNGAGLFSGTQNVAVQPDYTGQNGTANAGGLLGSVPLNGNAAPSAIAVDSGLGLAVVSEQGTNKVQILNIAPGGSVSLGAEVAVGNSPTSVAIDSQLTPPVAVVVNSADSTLSIIQLPGGALVATVDLSGLVPVASGATPATPYAVGIDPFSHRALVAFAKTNVGFVVNIDGSASPTCLAGKTPPYCPVSSVTLNTGDSPQIALEPMVHLAVVTPGGAGLLSVVDLTQANSTFTIQDAPNGAVRSNGIVTVKTNEVNNINPAVGGTVIITGVADASFNGSFSISSVLGDGHTFTYLQTGADATSGGGSISIGNPVLTFSVSNTIRGVSVNPISRTAMLADPNASVSQVSFIRTLDQSVTSLNMSVGSFLTNSGTAPEVGFRFTAFQPNLNVGVAYNPARNEISLIDPSKPQRLAPATFIGANQGDTGIGCVPSCSASPNVQVFGGVAVDPSNNIALVANAGSNSVQVFSLSNPSFTKNLTINQVLVPNGGGIPGELLPQATVTSGSALTNVRILGSGFSSSSQVRLDRTALPAGNVRFINSQEIDVDVPASFRAVPHHYALDVVNAGVLSNSTDFFVVQLVDFSSLCPGTSANASPAGVAIDETRNIAIVANTGCNSVSFISLNPNNFGAVTNTIAVGSAPVGVAVNSRLGFAVVSNSTSNTASVINLNTAAVTATVTVGTTPNGVAINPDTGQAIVANTGSNTVSAFDITQATPAVFTGATAQNPIAVAIDPDGNNGTGVAGVTGSNINGTLQSFGSLSVLSLSGNGAPVQSTILTVTTISATPLGIAFDPAGFSPLFYIPTSLANTVATYNTDTGATSAFHVGINPTSIASNYQTGTILTINSSSNTMSIIDARTFQTRSTLSLGSTSPFAAAIYPTTNLAVISDQGNNRVMLFPLPQ